jgi:hypothetical protein
MGAREPIPVEAIDGFLTAAHLDKTDPEAASRLRMDTYKALSARGIRGGLARVAGAAMDAVNEMEAIGEDVE